MKTVKIEKKVRQLLKAVKLRRTRQRTAVLTTLMNSPKPLTQDHISDMLGQKAPNKVTIYRVLEKLLDAGLVHRAFLRKRTWHYELSHNCSEKQCHPHFTCTDCGDTHCLTDVNLPMATSPNNGFVFQRQQVRLEGLCPRCSS
ncbi:MAG: Fur family transcriptional regulator [Planctomycetota bacterium]|jgi:Fur family ferric uptake transcriptional regulator